MRLSFRKLIEDKFISTSHLLLRVKHLCVCLQSRSCFDQCSSMPSLAQHAPLISLRHMVLYKCVLINKLIDEMQSVLVAF